METDQIIPSNLLLVVEIDGLATSTNPETHLWPISGYFSNISSKTKDIFSIGAYLGKTKPTNSNEYLTQFVNELNFLSTIGIKYKNKHVTISLSALICNASTKSFVLNVYSFNGLNGCLRCTTMGRQPNNEV